MSAIVEIQERIQNTVARIAEFEKVAAHPNAPHSILANIRALEKLQASLEREFDRAAMDQEMEVCRYRLLPPEEQRPALAAIARAWTEYQVFFSSVFQAVKYGPAKARTSKRASSESQFALAYTFSGSIGVTLTLPQQQTDYSSTRNLETTMAVVIEMTKSNSAESLSGFVARLGVPPVAKLGRWVDAHIAFGAGAGIEWRLSEGAASPLLLQIQEFHQLKEAMGKISEPAIKEETVSGMLLMADVDRHTFRMRLDSGERISGTFTDAISADQKAELPRRYVAVIRTTTTIKPAIEKMEVFRFLVRLGQELRV